MGGRSEDAGRDVEMLRLKVTSSHFTFRKARNEGARGGRGHGELVLRGEHAVDPSRPPHARPPPAPPPPMSSILFLALEPRGTEALCTTTTVPLHDGATTARAPRAHPTDRPHSH